MLKETKIGDAILVVQTTYYLYSSEEDRKNDHFFVSTSDKRTIDTYKKQIRAHLRKKKAKELAANKND
jgi:hypothetical protein